MLRAGTGRSSRVASKDSVREKRSVGRNRKSSVPSGDGIIVDPPLPRVDGHGIDLPGAPVLKLATVAVSFFVHEVVLQFRSRARPSEPSIRGFPMGADYFLSAAAPLAR